MVLAQGTLFVHHSDSPILTLWRFEFFPNESDAEATQLNVELYLNPSPWTIPIAAVASDFLAT